MAPVAQDVPTGLANLLKKEFRWLVCKKDQMKIESKLKVCRFIGELVKFKMFEAAEALFCLRFALTVNIFTELGFIDQSWKFTCGRF